MIETSRLKNVVIFNQTILSFVLSRQIINQISIPVLTWEQPQTWEGPISENELLKALKNMSNNKSPGNDGLTKEFYETFWENLCVPVLQNLFIEVSYVILRNKQL